jgi:hypothetical protein
MWRHVYEKATCYVVVLSGQQGIRQASCSVHSNQPRQAGFNILVRKVSGQATIM